MTIRRLNYTARRRITRDQVSITLVTTEGDQLAYEADLGLGTDYPPDASIYVEAYQGSRWERFSHGVIHDPLEPDSTVLSQFGPDDVVLFRVKVVEESADGRGRILGHAERLTPNRAETSPAARISLLPVAPADLGHRPWVLSVDDGPVLRINRAIGQWRDVAGSQEFRCLVLPQVVREVLRHVVIVQQIRAIEDLMDWPEQWLHFALRLPGVGPVPGTDDTAMLEEWVEDAVNAFCRRNSLTAIGRRLFDGEGS